MQGGLDLPPVLDLEETGGLAPWDVAQWARTWLQEVERLTGRPPIIYTGFYFWRDKVGGPTDFGRYPLWIANWTTAAAPSPIPSSWSTWTFWQHTSTGSSPGIPWTVDLNRFCCPDSHLDLLAGGIDPAFGNPFGAVDGATRGATTIDISGWTIDPDTTASIPVHVYVDGRIVGSTLAGEARHDVAGIYPGFGAAHGYSFSTPVGPGTHTICAYAINSGAGNANSELGCRTIAGDPVGSLDRIAREPGGAVRVSGWAFDPDTSGSINVGVYVNGLPWTTARADGERPDLPIVVGTTTTRHGFSIPVQGLSTSPVNICVFALNVGSGSNRNLGCRTIDARRNPLGSIDSAEVVDTGVRIRGWSLDPDTTASIPVHVYVDGRIHSAVSASRSRADVGAAFPGWGNDHGFEVTLPDLWIDVHDICVYGINTGLGNENPLLGCKRVNPRGEPFGAVDVVARAGGGVRVAGWMIDPDTAASGEVHVYVDDVATVVSADRSRPDVASAYPSFGDRHGFDAVVPASPGRRTICIWGINMARGMNHRLLGCRTLTA
jgi:hypothetical protein